MNDLPDFPWSRWRPDRDPIIIRMVQLPMNREEAIVRLLIGDGFELQLKVMRANPNVWFSLRRGDRSWPEVVEIYRNRIGSRRQTKSVWTNVDPDPYIRRSREYRSWWQRLWGWLRREGR